MWLSDREMEHAIRCGRLIVDPPTKVGPMSIDLHLDNVLQEDDIIAQVTVASVSSIPRISMKKAGSTTLGQRGVGGAQAG